MIPWSHPVAGINGGNRFALYQERDRVVLDMGCKRRDLLITCGEAEKLENELRRLANLCSLEAPSLLRGETWDLKVRSHDGLVCLRFLPPVSGCVTRVPLPYQTARDLADLVQFKRQQAAYRMQFLLRNA